MGKVLEGRLGKGQADMVEAKSARLEVEAGPSVQSDTGHKSDGDSDGDDNLAPVFSLVDGTYKSRRTFGTRRKDAKEEIDADGVRDLTIRSKEFSLAKLESAGSTL